jgi:hypothetical protein
MDETQEKIRKINTLIFTCLPQRRKNPVFSFFVNNLSRAAVRGFSWRQVAHPTQFSLLCQHTSVARPTRSVTAGTSVNNRNKNNTPFHD